MKRKKIAIILIFGLTAMISACKMDTMTINEDGITNVNESRSEKEDIVLEEEKDVSQKQQKNSLEEMTDNGSEKESSLMIDEADGTSSYQVGEPIWNDEEVMQQKELYNSEVEAEEEETEDTVLEEEKDVSQKQQKNSLEEMKDNGSEKESSLMIDEADGTSSYQVGEPIWNDAEMAQD